MHNVLFFKFRIKIIYVFFLFFFLLLVDAKSKYNTYVLYQIDLGPIPDLLDQKPDP